MIFFTGKITFTLSLLQLAAAGVGAANKLQEAELSASGLMLAKRQLFECTLLEAAGDYNDPFEGEEYERQTHMWMCEVGVDDDNNVYGVPGEHVSLWGLEIDKQQREMMMHPGKKLFRGKCSRSGFNVYCDGDFTVSPLESGDEVSRRLAEVTQGTANLLVLRVTAPDSSPCSTAAHLSSKIFGGDGNQVNLVSQYKACSHGKLNFVPATGANIVGGIADITITQNVTNQDKFTVMNYITAAANEVLGLLVKYDHVMYSYPPGTGSWIGYGYYNYYRTLVNCLNGNDWATFPSLQMHEIGHNLNLRHSGRGTSQYADETDLMGFSYAVDGGPLMCFNGLKSSFLKWFADKEYIVAPTSGQNWVGKIISSTDYDNAAADHNVIVQIQRPTTGDALYLWFNKLVGYNAGSKIMKNQVTIVSGTLIVVSSLLYGLLPQDQYVIPNFDASNKTLTISSTGAGFDGSIEFRLISVSLEGNPAAPSSTPPPPPTSSPTPAPPANVPTFLPTPNNVTASSNYFSSYLVTNLFDGPITLRDVGTTNNLGKDWAGKGTVSQTVVMDFGKNVIFNSLYYAQRSLPVDMVKSIKIWTYASNPGDAALRFSINTPPNGTVSVTNTVNSKLTQYYAGKTLIGRYVLLQFIALNPGVNSGGNIGGRELRFGLTPGLTAVMLPPPISANADSYFGNLSAYAPQNLFDGSVTLLDVNTTNSMGQSWAGQGSSTHSIVYDMGSNVTFNLLYYAQRGAIPDMVSQIKFWSYTNNPGTASSLLNTQTTPDAVVDITDIADGKLMEYNLETTLTGRYVLMMFEANAGAGNPGGKELRLGFSPTPVASDKLFQPPVSISASSYFGKSSLFLPDHLADGDLTLADVNTTNNLGQEWSGQGSKNHTIVYNMGTTKTFNTLYYSQRPAKSDKISQLKVWVFANDPGSAASLFGKMTSTPDTIVAITNMATPNLSRYTLGKDLTGQYIVMELFGLQGGNLGGQELRFGYSS